MLQYVYSFVYIFCWEVDEHYCVYKLNMKVQLQMHTIVVKTY